VPRGLAIIELRLPETQSIVNLPASGVGKLLKAAVSLSAAGVCGGSTGLQIARGPVKCVASGLAGFLAFWPFPSPSGSLL
jgi:hypothetical protein